MYPDKKSALKARNFSSTAWALNKLLLLGLVTASVAFALYVRVDSKTSKAEVAAQVVGQNGRYFNAQNEQQLRVDYRGEQNVIQAMQSGQAKARTLASSDLDGDSAPDLLAGYSYGGVGIVTIQRGNSEAFAPKDESIHLRMNQGYNPSSLLPTAQTYQVPEPADFLQAGDFNNDDHNDVLVGAKGRDLFLLKGDGQGNLDEPVQIALPGVVTAVAAGQFRAPDGRIDLAVGINGPSGPQVLVYDGVDGVLGEPMSLTLASPVTSLEFGEVDDSPFMGLAIATGSEINVIHGWGRKQSPALESRVEIIDAGMNVRGLASGFFMWSREGSKQLAALGDDGTIRIFGRGKLNTKRFTDQEITARARLRLKQKDTTVIDVETLSGWQSAEGKGWAKAREIVTSNLVGGDATAQNLLRSTHISFTETDDLVVLGGNSKLDIVNQINPAMGAPAGAKLIGGDFTATSLKTRETPTSVLALPQKLNGERTLVLLQAGSAAPHIVPLPPNTTITVDRTDDPSGAALTAASACTAAGNDCSLRGAVQFANNVANPGTTIALGTATYTLSINGNGGCVRESAATGNTIGDLEVNQTTTFMGNGPALTIINQIGTGTAPTFTGDRVLCMNVPLTAGLTFTFSGMTIVGGRDVASGIGGGGFIGGAKSTTLNLTNVTFANNQTSPGVPQGPVGGGGVAVTGGNMNVTNCTFGAANNPGASRTDLTLGNAATSLSGGGLSYSAGDPAGTNGATGTLAITGTTFTHNTSSSVSAGGGGLDVKEFNVSASTINLSTSAFTSNQATGTASGGGIINQSATALNISTTSFTSNSAGNRGGGIYVGGGTTNLNGTTPSITFSGNTATTAGSSISAASIVNLSGTNTTIGGDLEITTNGVWTNAVGSSMSPTNFIMTGTASFTGNNSTTNVGGNFNFGSGTFSAGTSLFNFNGTTAQSISNSSAITFFNLNDSNTTQPLTLNNSFAVSGTLNVNGASAILAPVAAAVISGGTGTLTGTGRVRVTRTGADSFFTQFTMPTRTLTNLTVEYIGAAAQTASVTTYSNLIINNGSGVSLGAGTTTVNNTLTLTLGALGVGTQTLVLNNGTTLGAGSITSSPTGTVNYNQGSAGQDVRAFNYGNLTFSAFTKVLASTGTIGVSGTLNPNGITSGHTITGSTIDFNGTGAQTVPVFNYNNLTISGAHGANNITLVNGGTIGIAGAFSPTATFAGGNYVVTNNTVDYNGSGAQIIAAFNYNNLTSSNVGARTLQNSGTIGIAGVFTLGTNVYTVTNSTVNFNGAGAQSIPAFNYFNLTSSNAGARTLPNTGTVGIAGAFTPGANAYTITGSTIDFNGTGAQTIAAFNYNNLTISQARGANNITLVNGGTIGIAGTFNPTATFAGGNYVVTNNTVNFNGSGPQTIPAFNYNNLTSSSTGARTLANSGNVGIAGIFTPGTNVFTITGSTVVYNGSTPQTLPNTFLTYNNLTLNNPAGVTGFAGLIVQGLLRVQAGTFTSSSSYNNVQIDTGATLAGTNATTINVSGNWTNNSVTGLTANGNTVAFNGSGAQVIGGTQSTTFNNLTIANAGGGVSLGQNISVNGVLTLTNDLNTGANILTMPGTGTSAGAADVIGNVRRTGFTGGGSALSFGNPFNSIGFAVGGTLPTDVTVNLVKAVPSGGIAFPTAVQRTYTITPTGGAGFSATLRLHYLDAELNSNVEADLGLWRFGAAWARQGKTASDTVNNWVELSGVTQFSPWTLSSAKNDSTTTITSDTPDPSIPNQVVPVNFTVVSNVAGAPAATGNVTITVNDASGDTCTGSVAAGTCNLTLTTLGSKTLTATYSSDANFNGSADTEAHEVVPVDVNIKDAQVGEPSSGNVNMVFTVTLSNPATSTGTVNFLTADGTATAGTCGSGGDYVTTSGTVTFLTGQQFQSISVPVCADASPEGDETFLVNLSTPTNLTIADGQATGTIKPNTPGTVLISEVRTSGPGGAADDFVEIYNNTNSPLTVAASDASAGYGLYKAGAAAGDVPVLIGTIPNGTVIPARGHYLIAGTAYSLSAYAAGDLPAPADIESDRNVGLFSTANVLNISSTNRLDAVGFGTNTGNNFDLLREGTNLGAASGSTAQHSFVRNMITGFPQDTNDNAADFVAISTDTSVPVGTITLPVLGGPGPENLASPIQRNATIKASLVDPGASANVLPNRIRDTASYTDTLTPSAPNGGVPASNPYTLGTLLIRRKFTNNTGAAITRLRFRIVDITTTNAPPGGGGQADVRALTSSTQSVTITGGSMVSVVGLTLEQPPTQARGGGLNSTVSAGTVTVGTPIAAGATINVNFLLGVATGGSYRFFINVEALP